MATTDDKYIVSSMSTVLIYPIEGLNLKAKDALKKIEEKVEKKLKALVDNLKAQHSKFEDRDFGPSEKDEYGAISFYGTTKPDPAGSKYPAPETLKWERPQYADNKFDNVQPVRKSSDEEESLEDEEEEEDDDDSDNDDDFGLSLSNNDVKVWCKRGKLFIDGSSSGDVIQGQLGDCWFLSALAVLGAKDSLLEICFYRGSEFQEFGLFVLRFFKDCNVIYVIIDDRLPVKEKDGRLIFAANKDPNELWVPLIEKAYAKLHGCYKSLIGGYTHYGLADMTGFCPRLVVMREGYLGYSEPYTEDEIWDLLLRYLSWNSLMGCSIQSNPKEKNKVEADAGQGLHFGHAYSFLGAGEITVGKEISPSGKVRLVKLRNPWGRGEWEGSFSDRSEEREKYNAEIEAVMNKNERQQERVVQNFNDGTFLMKFSDWMKYYTSLFVAINFPSTWCGKRTQGVWSSEQGGNREMGTWITNPKFKLRLEPSTQDGKEEYRQVFVGIYIKDSRLTLGYDYYKDPLYATPLAFDIVTENELKNPDPKLRESIPMGCKYDKPNATPRWSGTVKQAPYNFGTTQVEVYLKVGQDYYIVPSLYKRHQAGTFFLNVFADISQIYLDGSSTVNEAQKAMVVGLPTSEAPKSNGVEEGKLVKTPSTVVNVPTKEPEVLKMSVAQFYERKEALRERIISEASRLNLTYNQLQALFNGCKDRLTRSAFKRRMMEVGFMLTDFPDDDLVVLDKDNDGTISPQEFMSFYEEGIRFNNITIAGPQPERPMDDLLLKSIDLAGELTVTVFSARGVRQPTSWFALTEANGSSTEGNNGGNVKKLSCIRYDPEEAQRQRIKSNKSRLLNGATPPALVPDQANNTMEFSSPSKPANANAELITPSKTGPLRFLRDAVVSERGAGSVVSGISMNQKEAVQQAAASAAAKLHNDPQFRKAEVNRTKHLPLLRAFKSKQKEVDGAGQSVSGLGGQDAHLDSSVLRRRTSYLSPTLKRDITQDIDVMRLLNYFPPNGNENGVPATNQFRNAPLTMNKVPSSAIMRLPSQFSLQNSGTGLFVSSTPMRVDQNARSESTPFLNRQYDLWDYLIDCVVTITMSRPRNRNTEKQALFSKLKRQPLSSKSLDNFDGVKSPIPAPSGIRTPNKIVKGTIATPKAFRRSTGIASVSTVQSKAQQKNAVLEAKEKLNQLQREQGVFYEEIYRRLVSVPVTSYEEISGERSAQLTSSLSSRSTIYIRSLFQKFDRNLNGYISKDEFGLALSELNVEVSNEDCDIFFNRFRGKHGGNIDWKDFLDFFETHILGSTNQMAAQDSLVLSNQGLVLLLIDMKRILTQVLAEMSVEGIASIEKFLEKSMMVNKEKEKDKDISIAQSSDFSPHTTSTLIGKLPFLDNAIFQSLDLSQVKTNTSLLQSLGMVKLTVHDMARISRIFNFKVSLFMDFLRTPNIDLVEALDCMDVEISKELSIRSGMPLSQRGVISNALATSSANVMDTKGSAATVSPTVQSDSIEASSAATLKIWNSLAATTNATVEYEAFVSYLASMLSGTSFEKNDKKEEKGKSQTPSTTMIGNVNIEVLVRIVADTLVYSTWNRGVDIIPGSKNKQEGGDVINTTTLIGTLSFSGLDAYMRANRVNYIERKLKYLMQLESNVSNPTTNVLIHVYVSTKGDELVILANDPLTAEVYKIQLKEDVKQLPFGDQVKKMITQFRDWEILAKEIAGPLVNKVFSSESLYLYNPIDTPVEDKAISDLVKRLKIVRTRTNESEMILTEDPKFISQLKILLDSASNILPFFFLVNDLNLCFEVDENHLSNNSKNGNNDNNGGQSSLRGFVFGCLRNHKPLYVFLTQVRSSLKVVLSTYNGTSRETFSWEEMLAHLTNYRNPFITVHLLPTYITPENYLYDPNDKSDAFTGDDDESDLEEQDDNDENRLVVVNGKEKKRRKNWQRGPVDFDGAPHPCWNNQFIFDFEVPKLSSCSILCTEVVKMRMDDSHKYVMAMLREGSRLKMTYQPPPPPQQQQPNEKIKTNTTSTTTISTNEKENFYFITIYDPRSATEYQCGVKPNCILYEKLYYHKFPNGKKVNLDIKEWLMLLGEAADQEMLILGPAITPRLEIQVYNYKDNKIKELLGQCQVSISSVLSGSGVGEKAWITLVYKQDKEVVAITTTSSSSNNNRNTITNTTTNSNSNNGNISGDSLTVRNKTIDMEAGEILVELSFRRSIEIEAERQIALEKAERLQQKINKIEQKRSLSYAADDPMTTSGKSTGRGSGIRIQELESECANLRSTVRQLQDQTTIQPIPKGDNNTSIIDPEKEKLQKERDEARNQAENTKREKAALEAQLKQMKEQLAQLTQATTTTTTTKTQENNNPVSKVTEDTTAKLLAELNEMKKQNEQLKMAEIAAKNKLNELAAATTNASATTASVGESVKATGSDKKNIVPQSGPIAKESKAVLEIPVKTESIDTSPSSPLRRGTGAKSGFELTLSRDNFDDAVQQLLLCLWNRQEKKSVATGTNLNNTTGGENKGDIKVTAALNGFNALLNSYANIEGLISHRDVVNACAELSIDMETETAVRLLQEIGPNQRKLVQVHSLMDYLTRELVQIIKHGKKATRSTTEIKPPASSIRNAQDESSNKNVQAMLMEFQNRLDSRGKTVTASSPTAALDGLKRLLTSYANPEGLISSRDVVNACAELMVDFDSESAVSVVQESGGNSQGLVTVQSLMDYLGRELVNLIKAQRKSDTPAGPSNRPGVNNASSPVANPEKKRSSSTTNKTRPLSATAVPMVNKTDKNSGNGPNSPVPLERSKDDSSESMKPGVKRVLTDVRKSLDEPSGDSKDNKNVSFDSEIDWSKEPLPPNWERRFHAPSNRYVYVDHQAKRTQWHHPLQQTQADLNKTDGQGRTRGGASGSSREQSATRAESKRSDSLASTSPAVLAKAMSKSSLP